MNPTDIDFGNRIGNELKGTSSLYSPPSGMYPRVAERERQLNRRRATHRAGAAGLAAVATIGGVAWGADHPQRYDPSQPTRCHTRGPCSFCDRKPNRRIPDHQLARPTRARCRRRLRHE